MAQVSQASQASQVSGPHAAVANESLLRIAERELIAALVLQERPMAGMYVQSSRAGDAALDHAVHVLCAEAHRLDLRPEEMLIALKQAWSHLATARARNLGDRDGDVLRSLVTTSIEIFFESRSRTPNEST